MATARKKAQPKTVSLELEAPEITSEQFIRAVEDFFGMIDEVASEVAEQKGAVRWLVSVEKGSARVIARPEPIVHNPTLVTNTIRALREGVRAVDKGPSRPKYFSNKALEKLRDLSALRMPTGVGKSKKPGIARVSIVAGRVGKNLSEKTAKNIELIFGAFSKDLGSVEGRISTISERRGLSVVVYDSLTDKAVRCYIPEDMKDKAIQAFGKRVSVFGRVTYPKDGEPYSIQAKELRVLKDSGDVPGIYAVRGILGKV